MAARRGALRGARHAARRRAGAPRPQAVQRPPRPGPRVIDFGIASLADATRLTVTHEAAGTPGYVAPEQLRGMRGVGPAADVFALTCLLLYAGTGRTPFRSRTFVEYIAHVLHEPPDLTGVHGPLAELAHGGLALDPGERLDLPALAALCARHARVDDAHGFADLLVPAARDLLTHASAEAATEQAFGVPATKPQTDGAELPDRPHTRAADARPWVWTAPGLGEGEYVAFQGPALDRDAGIVCLAGGGTIHGFDAATGAQRWSVQAGFELRAGPVPAHGVFVFADDQGRAYGHRARDGVRLWERDPDGEAGRPVTDIRLLVTDTPEQLVVLRVGRRAGEPESDYTWDDIALLRPDTGMAVTTKPRHGDSSPRRDDANWVVGDRLFIAGYERLASVGFGADEGSSWTEKAHAAVSIGERTYTWRSFGGLVCRDGATGTALWRSRKPRGPSLSALVGTPDGETVLVVTGRGIWAHAARTGRLRWTTSVADVGRRPRVDRAGVTAGVVWSAFGSVLLGHDLADGRPLWRLTAEEPYLTMAVEPHGGLLHVHDGRRLRGIRPADGGDAWSVASHERSSLGDFLPHWTAGGLLYVREESGVRAYDVLRDA
ncbi:outer membrane protein assembly factor BamB family protein [Streptomyces justiciae]|uniref:outer membrane protein assembly factor BamB family protein n=1 Tax=Streptomyces justiciae TaxID=2780140 RepID=UPI003908AD0A